MAPFLKAILPPKITSPFGPRVIEGKPNNHNGIDIKADYETLYAPLAGDIMFGYNELSGNFARIDHGPFVTAYAHLSSALTAKDTVAEGEPFAVSGDTGHSFGAHLHFGIQIEDIWIDPTDWFKALYSTQALEVAAPISGAIVLIVVLFLIA